MGADVQAILAQLLSDIVGIVGKLFAADSTGLPRVPSVNVAFNAALATKWYTKPGYFTRYAAGGKDADATKLAAGIGYWTIQITEDGPQRAWANFINSTQPVADGVAASVAALPTTDGGPYVLGN